MTKACYGEDDELADSLCKEKPLAGQAVSGLRRMRLENRKPASSIGVFEAVITALNNYCDAHPDTTYEHMLEGTRGALGAVERTQEEAKKGAK